MTGAKELSRRVTVIVDREIPERQLRPMLRVLFPNGAAKDRGTWSLKARQVRLVKDVFRLIRTYEEGDRAGD